MGAECRALGAELPPPRHADLPTAFILNFSRKLINQVFKLPSFVGNVPSIIETNPHYLGSNEIPEKIEVIFLKWFGLPPIGYS